MRLATGLLALAAMAGLGVAAGSPASASGYGVEYVFKGGHDGMQPAAVLIEVGGKLYGTTGKGGVSGMGTIFSFDPSTGAETRLYSFTDGSPDGGLVEVDGKLYGSTGSGGGGDCPEGCGTVFSFDPGSGVETVLQTFRKLSDEGPGPLVAIGHKLYGTTFGHINGTVFSFDLNTGAERTLHVFHEGAGDGLYPVGPMLDVGGVLYGVTQDGGSLNCGGVGCGSVYMINPDTHAEKVLYGFTGGADGGLPDASLTALGGILYGTTVQGGSSGNGVVFSIDPATGAEKLLYAFKGGADGAQPFGGSLTAVGGVLYGVTFRGGAAGCGAVYSVNPTTGAEQVLHSFACTGPSTPAAGLFFTDHRLFGTLISGGKKCDLDCGALFSIRP